jgi:uncharacterized delta-60 repeat protein
MNKFKYTAISCLLISTTFFAQDGTLDESFGTNGVVVATVGTEDNDFRGVDISIDNEIFIIGGALDIGEVEYNSFLLKYEENGVLDTSFATNGVMISTNVDDDFRRIVVLNDKSILIGIQNSSNYKIQKFDSQGNIDTSFGTNGLLFPNGQNGYLTNFVVDENENIVTYNGYLNNTISVTAIRRFLPNGVLDETFGTNGLLFFELGNESTSARSVIPLPSSKLLVNYTETTNNTASKGVARLFNDGTLDESFANSGTLTLPVEEEFNCTGSPYIDGDFLVGCSYFDFNNEVLYEKTLRLKEDGTLNHNFGNNGVLDGYAGGRIQENNRIILPNFFYDFFEGGVSIYPIRIFSDGAMDNSWNYSSAINEFWSLSTAFTNDGKFLVAGSTPWYNGSPTEIILQRFNNTSLGVNENKLETFIITPNPTNDIVTITCAECFLTNKRYQITDTTGKVIQTASFSVENPRVSMEGLATGLYYLTIENTTVKLLKK